MADRTQTDQALSLKVMRLIKPSFQVVNPAVCEPSDIPANIPGVIDRRLPAASVTLGDGDALGLTEMLTLPSSFGTIYLGEMFCSYISVNNSSGSDVSLVGIKAELQTQTQRFILLDRSPQQIPKFVAGASNDFVVQHEVKEEGIHILVCSANYTKLDGERKYFRKLFKFKVENPLRIKTRTHNLQGDVLLEVEVQNASKQSFFLEQVVFKPVSLFGTSEVVVQNDEQDTTRKLKKEKQKGGDVSLPIPKPLALPPLLPGQVYMKPDSSKQYLYRLSPKDPNSMITMNANVLGHMEVVWKGALGEGGRLRSGQIERLLPHTREIELRLLQIPSDIRVERPFTLQCEITNRSGRKIFPRLFFINTKTSGVMLNGEIGRASCRERV
eukprot:TRINITY_DN3343_c0_g1_i2.p1 TRINITY_DN3343_c0_g1~~TRINITY_DN3343_c0_g1_i2.p1  ORF type:complete len:384 (+),score=86.03 TRINITY_DN3343_c0_g1_i2:315-1466(+)